MKAYCYTCRKEVELSDKNMVPPQCPFGEGHFVVLQNTASGPPVDTGVLSMGWCADSRRRTGATRGWGS